MGVPQNIMRGPFQICFLRACRALLLSQFHLHRFRLQVLLPMDTYTSSRRALKLTQEQEVAEDWTAHRETRETERDVLQRLWNKEARKRRERGRATHAAQTSSERQATSQWKSTHER